MLEGPSDISYPLCASRAELGVRVAALASAQCEPVATRVRLGPNVRSGRPKPGQIWQWGSTETRNRFELDLDQRDSLLGPDSQPHITVLEYLVS